MYRLPEFFQQAQNTKQQTPAHLNSLRKMRPLNMKPSMIAGILCSALCVLGAQASDAVSSSAAGAVVVEIDGAKITSAELQKKYGGRLFQARTTNYLAERTVLDEIIVQYLLEQL